MGWETEMRARSEARRPALAVVGVALAFLVATRPAVAEDGPWDVTEVRRHAMPPGINPQDLTASPEARHLAYAERRADGVHLVVDGVAGPAFTTIDGLLFGAGGRYAYFGVDDAGVHVLTASARYGPFQAFVPTSLKLSEDGHHHAWIAEAPAEVLRATPGAQAVYLDGAALTAHPKITTLALSRAGWRVAFVVAEQQGQRVVVFGQDNEQAGPFDEIDPVSLRLERDDQPVAYTARRGTSWHVVFGGHVGPPAARVGGRLLTVSPDGRRWACWTATGPKPRYVVDGTEHPLFAQVDDHLPLFSADSKRVVYTAQDERGWHVVVDGAIVQTWVGVAGRGIAASADGSHLLYAAQRDGRWWMQAGPRVHGPYDAIGDRLQAISTDGQHTLFAARKGGAWHIVHDGRESSAVQAVIATALSPDGQHRAYGALVAGRPRLVIDDTVLEGTFVLPGGLAFDAAGVLYALGAQDPANPQLVALSIAPRR